MQHIILAYELFFIHVRVTGRNETSFYLQKNQNHWCANSFTASLLFFFLIGLLINYFVIRYKVFEIICLAKQYLNLQKYGRNKLQTEIEFQKSLY